MNPTSANRLRRIATSAPRRALITAWPMQQLTAVSPLCNVLGFRCNALMVQCSSQCALNNHPTVHPCRSLPITRAFTSNRAVQSNPTANVRHHRCMGQGVRFAHSLATRAFSESQAVTDVWPSVFQRQQPGGPSLREMLTKVLTGAVGAAAVLAVVSSTLVTPVALAEPAVLDAASGPVGVMKPPPQLESKTPQLSLDELNNIRIFQENTPSVVNITNLRLVQDRFLLDLQKIPAGVGSGFIWDHNGTIVTNYHVIKGAAEVQVTLLDQSSYTAKVIGADPDKDIAVLKLDLSKEVQDQIKPVTLGSSEDLLVGQKVFAIGNPFGLDHTLTQGIISGLGRELDTGLSSIKNVIQTDAAINPGNSGGVLLDSQGRVIGINTAILDPTGKGANNGVGFAIPISDVKGLVEQILTTGKVSRPALGITIGPPQMVQQLGIEGVLVLEVPEGSPAASAGMRGAYRDRYGAIVINDIIVGIDGKPVRSMKDMFGVLDTKRVGDKVKVDVLRRGEVIRLSVTLGERSLGRAE